MAATGPEAVKEIAAASRLPEEVVDRHARRLKEAGRDLWPLSRRGGGRGSAYVQPKHVTNLVLALAAAHLSPVDSPNVVERFRTLRIEDVRLLPNTGEHVHFIPAAGAPQETKGSWQEYLGGDLPVARKFGDLPVAATLGQTLDAFLVDGIPKTGLLLIELDLDDPREAVIRLIGKHTMRAWFLPADRSGDLSMISRKATVWGHMFGRLSSLVGPT
jgi:hypothetical protein